MKNVIKNAAGGRGALWVVLLTAAVLLCGCVKRKISISSTPSGALVYLNDQEVGRTPVDVNFVFYGTYDVRLVKQGYQPLWTTGNAAMPWWEFPGPDLIAEILPGDKLVQINWHYDLEETTEMHEDPDKLLDNAEQMRLWTQDPANLEQNGADSGEQKQPAGEENLAETAGEQ